VPLTGEVLYQFLITETALLQHIKYYHDVLQSSQKIAG